MRIESTPYTFAGSRADSLARIGGDGGNGGINDGDVLQITMAPISSVHGAQPGAGVTVGGTWLAPDFGGPFEVSVSAGGLTFPATISGKK